MATFAALIYLFIYFEYCLLEIPLYVGVLQHHCRMPDFLELEDVPHSLHNTVQKSQAILHLFIFWWEKGKKTFADTFKYSI